MLQPPSSRINLSPFVSPTGSPGLGAAALAQIRRHRPLAWPCDRVGVCAGLSAPGPLRPQQGRPGQPQKTLGTSLGRQAASSRPTAGFLTLAPSPGLSPLFSVACSEVGGARAGSLSLAVSGRPSVPRDGLQSSGGSRGCVLHRPRGMGLLLSCAATWRGRAPPHRLGLRLEKQGASVVPIPTVHPAFQRQPRRAVRSSQPGPPVLAPRAALRAAALRC